MNCFQRAWRSLCRKPMKSALLFCVVLVISLLLLCGFSARTATIAANDSTRQAVGASFLLEANAENRAQRLAAASAKIGEREGTADGVHQGKRMVNGQEMWQIWTDNSFETLQREDIEKIAQTAGLADYTITTAPEAVKSVGFSRIEDAGADQSGDAGGVALFGERQMRLNTNVSAGILTLAEGRWITPSDDHACVISQALAEKNTLDLGDDISFASLDGKGSTEQATIVGIFREAQPLTPYMSGDTYRAENVIFCDLDLPEQVSGEGALYERAIFSVADVDNYDSVKAALLQTDIDWSRYDLIDNNGNLETLAANFGSLAQTSDGMIVACCGCGLALLLFVLAFWVRTRRRELGIFCALGARKRALWLQLLSEALVVSVPALALSFAAAPLVSDGIGSALAQLSIEQESLAAKAETGKVATDYVAPEMMLTQIETSLSPRVLALDAAVTGALVGSAVSLTLVWTLRRKPQELLNTVR